MVTSPLASTFLPPLSPLVTNLSDPLPPPPSDVIFERPLLGLFSTCSNPGKWFPDGMVCHGPFQMVTPRTLEVACLTDWSTPYTNPIWPYAIRYRFIYEFIFRSHGPASESLLRSVGVYFCEWLSFCLIFFVWVCISVVFLWVCVSVSIWVYLYVGVTRCW